MLERLDQFALKRPRWIIVAAVLLVWAHTTGFEFIWDDHFFITENPAVRSLRHLPEILLTLDAQAEDARTFLVYRPLRTAVYALLHAAGGGVARPALYHAMNLAWHAAAACLVFGVARRLFRHGAEPGGDAETRARRFALLAGVFFAVHPVLSETVCWAKGLDDIMAAAFTLLATRLLLDWRGDWPRYAGAALAMVAALYSKESAFPWVAVAGLLIWKFHGRTFSRSVLLAMPLAALTLLALVHRHVVMGRSSQTAPISGTHWQTLIDMFPTVPQYARVILGIPPFSPDYSYLSAGHAILSASVLPGLVLLVTVIVATGLALKSTSWRVAGLGGAWFLLFMLPVANLIPMMQYMAERFLYLPLAGLVIVASTVLWRAPRSGAALAGGIAVAALWAGTAWNRSWAWQDELTLWIRARIECPHTPRVEMNAVAAVLKQPHMRGAFVVVRRPGSVPYVDVAPPETRAKANWTVIKATLREMERQFPSNSLALNSIGLGLAFGGEPEEALRVLHLAAKFPTLASVNLHRSFGLAYALAGRRAEAVAALDKSLAESPDDLVSWTLLAVVCRELGDFKRAAAAFDKLTALEPSDPTHARNRDDMRARNLPP